MAKQRKAWMFSAEKMPKASLPGTLKDEVDTKGRELIEGVLKPMHVKPPPEGSQFNFITDITTKWISSTCYFISIYACPGPNAIAPTFEEKFARMEYVGDAKFNLSFMRHTGKWVDLYASISVEECMKAIQTIRGSYRERRAGLERSTFKRWGLPKEPRLPLQGRFRKNRRRHVSIRLIAAPARPGRVRGMANFKKNSRIFLDIVFKHMYKRCFPVSYLNGESTVAYFTSRKVRKQISSARLWLEALEDRTVPSATVFDASHVLVRFASDAAAPAVLAPGLSLGENYSFVPGLREVKLSGGETLDQALSALRANPNVLYAQPDYQLDANLIPNDPSFNKLWGLNNTGQTGGTAGADIRAASAWDASTGTGKLIVAVIDTGIDYTHPDLQANMWVNAGEIPGNGIDDDGDGFVDDVYGYNFVSNTGDPMDDNSHGTHVAGTIGAVGNNGIGVAGVDWNVQLMAVKFLDASGSGSTSNAIKALNFAVNHGATISNNSWGGGGFNQALSDAIASAGKNGHIFVAAAGNNGTSDDTTAFYPASYNLGNVVSVAATDSNDKLASFSNYGASTVDLGAPGVSIYSTIPVSMGSYGYKSGTSMATPHVTGALALVWDQHPSWTYQQVINQVMSTVDPLASLSGKVVSGGRLDLAKALGAAAVPALSINNVSLAEGNSATTSFTFTVSLSAASAKTVTVNFASANGSATAGSDYQSASGTLTFSPGQTSQTVTVLVNGDTTVEPDETFFVNLSGATNATIATAQGTGTIRNDDSPPALAINNVSVAEGNSGTTNFTFTVSLSLASAQTVTVNFATADGSATAASGDYQSASGALTFTPGQTSQSITVLVNGDTTVESNETFFVNLSGAANATIASGQGTGTIVNDDSPPITISIGNAAVIEGNSGTTNDVFIVSLSAAYTSTVTVDYSTVNGVATASSDYLAASGTLSFAPGETTKNITVAVLGDTEIESDEVFYVNLSGASNASIASSQGVGTIRNDDTAIAIANLTQSLASNGTTNFVFTVSLAQPSALTVSVNFATANGSLTSPTGFNATSGTLTFAPGVTSQTITVKVKKAIVGDYFFVNLSGAANAFLVGASAKGTVGSGTASVSSASAPQDYWLFVDWESLLAKHPWDY